MAAISSCGPGMATTLRDAVGREVTVADTSRIVSVGGAVTEILYALGLEDRIVAVDTTSLYPPRAMKEKPSVGYMRALSPEGVLGLAPTLVLASEGSGPKETVAVLEAAAVPYVHVPDHFTGEGIIEKVRLVATVAGAEERGTCLANAVACGPRCIEAAARGDRAAGEGAVRSLDGERPSDGGGPQHRRRRHHQARGRGQRDHRV